jgi:tetratricopeptide (TPR) repeat protein
MRDLLHLARFLFILVLILAIDALAGEPRNPVTELRTGKNSRLAQEALARFKSGKAAEMVPVLEEAVSLDPESPLLHHLLGVALRVTSYAEDMARRDADLVRLRAMEEQDEALRLFPGYGEAWYERALLLESMSQYKQAAETMALAIRFEPLKDSYREDQLRILVMTLEPDAPIRALREWVALQPNNWNAHAMLGSALAGTGKVEEGIAEYRRSLELKRSDWVPIWLGTLLAERGRWKEADAAFAQGEGGTEFALCWYSRAVMQVRMGHMKEAQGLLAKLKETGKQHNLVKRLEALLKDPKSEAALDVEAYEAP